MSEYREESRPADAASPAIRRPHSPGTSSPSSIWPDVSTLGAVVRRSLVSAKSVDRGSVFTAREVAYSPTRYPAYFAVGVSRLATTPALSVRSDKSSKRKKAFRARGSTVVDGRGPGSLKSRPWSWTNPFTEETLRSEEHTS